MTKLKNEVTEAELWTVFNRADELIYFATDKKTGKINPVVDKDSLRELSEVLDKATGQSLKERWDDPKYNGTQNDIPLRYIKFTKRLHVSEGKNE